MKKPKTAPRSKTNKPRVYLATIRRPWAELPLDARVDRRTAAAFAGVNIRTIQRHVDRGLFPSGAVTKSDVDKWIEGVGPFKPGYRPAHNRLGHRLGHARQQVLPLD